MKLTAGVYLLSLLVVLLCGVTGPQVFNHTQNDLDAWHNSPSAGVPFSWSRTFPLKNLRAEEQLIYLKFRLERVAGAGQQLEDEVKLTSTVSVVGEDEGVDKQVSEREQGREFF